MSNDAYTLKKKKGTDEYHLFIGTMNPDNGCTSKNKSICQMMKRDEQEGNNIFACQDEESARKKCAEIGRKICGVCVSSLYTTYE